jgi:hypothetical protein
MIAPLATIFGPRSWPFAILSRNGYTSAPAPPILRIPSTPLATYIFRSRSAFRKCVSQRTGIRNFPEASTTWAVPGILVFRAEDTDTIWPSRTTTVMSGCCLPAPGLMTVTCTMANPPDWAMARGEKTLSAITRNIQRSKLLERPTRISLLHHVLSLGSQQDRHLRPTAFDVPLRSCADKKAPRANSAREARSVRDSFRGRAAISSHPRGR